MKRNEIDQVVRENRKKQALRIDEICERMVCEEFDPAKTYSFGEIKTCSDCKDLLKKLFGADIVIDEFKGDEWLHWKDTRQYSSGLHFRLSYDAPMRHDLSGKLVNPLMLPINEESRKSILAVLNGNELVYVAHGQYLELFGESGEYDSFRISTEDVVRQNGEDNYHILLAVKWGGANSKTRGVTASFAKQKLGATFFQKQASGNGREGIDYIIVPAASSYTLYFAISKALVELAFQEKSFQSRWRTFQRCLKDHKDIDTAFSLIFREVVELAAEYASDPVADLLYVSKPEPTVIDEPQVEHLSLDMKESAMLELIYTAKSTLREAKLKLATERLRMEAWREFAPQFASLHDWARRLHGWLEVRGDHATVTLPAHEPDQEHMTMTYSLSAQRLNDLIEDLDQYELAELEANKQNQSRLANQPTVEELLRRQADEIEARKAAMHRSEAKNPSANPRVDRNDESSGDSDNKALEIPTLIIELN